jgi:radical SAM superfamily enzyme YgiQ (UPF0313 family)
MANERGPSIVLIMPRAPLYQRTHGFRRYLRYAPLTLTTLAAFTPPSVGAQIRIIDEGVEEVDYGKLSADLVGITSITGTTTRAYAIASQLRSRGIPVVFGGSHPTIMPEEAKSHGDSVVIGLGNRSWPALVQDFVSGTLKPFYDDPDGHVDGMPFARRDLLRRRGYITVNTVQATYGCPHTCEFCVVGIVRPHYIHRPVDEVIEEIKSLHAHMILFLDPSPTEDKQYIKSLYRALIPLKIHWMGLATTRITEDPELFDLLVKSGCQGLLIGFESVSQASLERMGKSFGHADQYANFVRMLHDNGIAIQGCFALGSDFDGPSIFDDTLKFITKTGMDLPRYTVVTPFPRTPFFNQLKAEDRILTEDWSLYNCQNVVFRPRRMSPEALQSGLEYVWRESYRLRNVATRLSRSRTRLLYSILANIGYLNYARDLSRLR